MSRNARIVLGIVLVAGAGPAGFLMYRTLLGGRSPPSTAVAPATLTTPSSAGGLTATAPSSVPTHPPPDTLPDLALPDAQGKVHHLSEWRGHPLLLNFWATWCEPCRREIPLLKSLRQQPSAASIAVVGLAIDMKDVAVKYAHDMGIDYPVLIGEDGGSVAMDAFGVAGVLPFTVFADSQGRILTLKIGELHKPELRAIVTELQDVDAGRIELAAARQKLSEELKQLAVTRAVRS